MNVLSTIAGIVGGGLNPIFGLLTSTMQSGFRAAIQFHKEGIAFARDVGLSAKQAQAYTNVLIERTQVLANKYGVTADAILQVQRGLSEATGKQLMLNEAQAESIVQIDKLVGAQTRVKFQEEIMNGMGGQIDTANKALANVYATAAKQGLVAKKLSDKVAQNLSMANRLSFRNGIDGITRMAALSEKLGFKMQSVESAASKFLDLDKAIENAAHMQMLGGSAAVSFGNPLTAAYEANYDPEAFAKRMTDSLTSYATFDKTKGIANINGMNMDFVRQIGEQLGIGAEEAARIAKKQAEVQYKETALGGVLNRVAGGDEAKRNYILNNSQVTDNGRGLQINGKDVNSITDKEWADMLHFDGMSDTQILQEQAMKLTSIDEHISGAAATVTASFANGIDEYLPGIGEKIQSIGNAFSKYAEQWGKDTGKVVGKAMHWINTHADEISTVFGGILKGMTWLVKVVSEYTKTAIAAFAIWKLLLKPSLAGTLGGSGGGTSLGAKASKGVWGGLKGLFTTSRDTNIATRMGYADARASGSGRFMSALKAPFRGASLLTTGQKIANVGGAALGVGLGMFNAVSANENYADRRKELNEQLKSGAINKAEYDKQVNEARQEKNAGVGEGIGTALGATIGTFIGGPIGTAIGGWLGGMGGKLIGENWTKITSFITEGWDGAMGKLSSLWDDVKTAWSDYVVNPFKEYVIQPIKDVVQWANENILQPIKGFIQTIKSGFDKILQGIQKFLDDPWGTIKQGASNAYESAKEKAKGVWEDTKGWFKEMLGIDHAEGGFINNGASGVEHPVLAQKGEVILNPTQQKNFMALANDNTSVKAKPVGDKEYIYTPNRSETSNVNGNTVTVKDFNINLNGTIKLDGGNNSKDIDVAALLNDYQFMNSLKEMIKDSMNRDMSGGRRENNFFTLRNHPSVGSVYGH